MNQRTFFYACTAAFGAVIGFLLRNLELQVYLNRETMLMDFGIPSLLLLLLCAAAMASFALLGRGLDKPAAYVGYGESFGGKPVFFGAVAAAVLLLAGAVLSLRRLRSGDSRIFAVLAVLAILSGAGWLKLSLDARQRRPGGCRLWAAALPELMVCLFLILFYKSYAPQPAMLYVLYPFLGLCAALGASHLLAGYTVKVCRPWLTLFCCGSAAVLCITAIPGVAEADYRLYLLAFALQSFFHGLSLFQDPTEAIPAPAAEVNAMEPDEEPDSEAAEATEPLMEESEAPEVSESESQATVPTEPTAVDTPLIPNEEA